jgi:quercetin dioxygenase-like cupin family protein
LAPRRGCLDRVDPLPDWKEFIEVAPKRLTISPTEGEQVQIGPGLGVVFKIEGHETGGAFSVVEHPIEPRTLVIPHVHEREDEFSYVLEGEIGARIGEQELTAGPGAYVLKPRGIPHTFWNPTDRPARVLEIISPAGFEMFFREWAAMLAAPGEPDIAAMDALDDRYRVGGQLGQMDWIPDLMQRYGLNSPL